MRRFFSGILPIFENAIIYNFNWFNLTDEVHLYVVYIRLSNIVNQRTLVIRECKCVLRKLWATTTTRLDVSININYKRCVFLSVQNMLCMHYTGTLWYTRDADYTRAIKRTYSPAAQVSDKHRLPRGTCSNQYRYLYRYRVINAGVSSPRVLTIDSSSSVRHQINVRTNASAFTLKSWWK